MRRHTLDDVPQEVRGSFNRGISSCDEALPNRAQPDQVPTVKKYELNRLSQPQVLALDHGKQIRNSDSPTTSSDDDESSDDDTLSHGSQEDRYKAADMTADSAKAAGNQGNAVQDSIATEKWEPAEGLEAADTIEPRLTSARELIRDEEWSAIEHEMLDKGLVHWNGATFTMTKEFASKVKKTDEYTREHAFNLMAQASEHNKDRFATDDYLKHLTHSVPGIIADGPHMAPQRYTIPNLEARVIWTAADDGSLVEPVLCSVFPSTNIDVDLHEALTDEGHVTMALYKTKPTALNPRASEDWQSVEERRVEWPRGGTDRKRPAVFHMSIAYKTADPNEEGSPFMYEAQVQYATWCKRRDAIDEFRSANKCIRAAGSLVQTHEHLAAFTKGKPYSMEVDENCINENVVSYREQSLPELRALTRLRHAYLAREVGLEEGTDAMWALDTDHLRAQARWSDESVIVAFETGNPVPRGNAGAPKGLHARGVHDEEEVVEREPTPNPAPQRPNVPPTSAPVKDVKSPVEIDSTAADHPAGNATAVGDSEVIRAIDEMIAKRNRDAEDMFRKKAKALTDRINEVEISCVNKIKEVEISCVKKINEVEISCVKKINEVEISFVNFAVEIIKGDTASALKSDVPHVKAQAEAATEKSTATAAGLQDVKRSNDHIRALLSSLGESIAPSSESQGTPTPPSRPTSPRKQPVAPANATGITSVARTTTAQATTGAGATFSEPPASTSAPGKRKATGTTEDAQSEHAEKKAKVDE